MRTNLSQGDLAELDGMPVSTSGNSYRDFMHAAAFLQAGMEPGPPPKVSSRSLTAGFQDQPSSPPGWLQEEW